jgi:Putative zinc-finger
MDCATFDALLIDALDGLLAPAEEIRFRSHAKQCAPCGAMFAEVEQGMMALKSLEEIEPPAHLVHNVMAKTAFADHGITVHVPGGVERQSVWTQVRNSVIRPVMQPRFAMSLGMAFFSITFVLNVAGVSRKDLLALRPSTFKTTATVKLSEAEGKIFAYFDNIRFVYEFETLIRNVKKNDKKPAKPNSNNKNDDTSEARPSKPAGEMATLKFSVGPSATHNSSHPVKDLA